MRRFIVTGGAGFIGSNFVRMFLREHPDYSVTVLDKLTYAGNLENLRDLEGHPRYAFVRGDIADIALVDSLAAKADCILNFAAESHVDRSLLEAGSFVTTDVYGTWVLLEAARKHGHQRFLQVSTDEVYGHVATGRSVESDRLAPRSPYSASKAGGEMLVWAYRASFDVPALITRGSNNYGPYQYPEKIIPLFITNAMDDLPLPIYGDGSALRDYIHVEDHCRGIDTVLHHGVPGEAYNVGAGGETSGLTVADLVLEALGKPATLKQLVADRAGHDYRYCLDNGKLRGLGWSPRFAVAEGVAETVRWYRENEAWWRPLKSGEYWDFYRRNYRPAEVPAAEQAR
ncbi:MAG TPA: dTDP-glucose 4,6-dehydratase [Candidatus Dormibacteraeota bacterium]|jgi:dTDP-glucose 4,6-dehydratase|nr:dTDP-glucose 4,6-dehydratase [Candidatus Dormibacteraeota bacterium]